MEDADDLVTRFESARPRLRAIATSMLGSTADADDVVQEAWLRLERVETAEIENLDAWLTTVVSRLSLDQLKSHRRGREQSWHVEPWRDEPTAVSPDPADIVADADRVSVALLIVLETLTPAERIAFVLHDIFGRPFDEIAEAVQRTPQAARQLASRARRRLREASEPARTDRRRARRLVDAWLKAVEDGDIGALLELLDDGAVLHADFGTHTQVLSGMNDIAAQASLLARLAAHSTPVLIDGAPGVAAVVDGRVVSIMAFTIEQERITALKVLADPRRLAELDVLGRLGIR